MNEQLTPGALLDSHLDQITSLAPRLSGCLSEREGRFLALVAATLPPSLGEILEIGSFKGKSTTILALSVPLSGGDRVIAVDPLTLPAPTDPSIESDESLPDVFWNTLESNGVKSLVDFHQVRSEQLASTWNKPLRFLWIDGDHTYRGAVTDFDNFADYLRPGAVVAFHDVLHPAEGPIRTFCERVLLSSNFGPCGVTGSIGWAQYIGRAFNGDRYIRRKRILYRKLSRMIPYISLNYASQIKTSFKYKVFRPLVPHGDVNARGWISDIKPNLPGEFRHDQKTH